MGVWLFILLLFFEKIRQNCHFNAIARVLWRPGLPRAQSDRLVGSQSAFPVHLEPTTKLLKRWWSSIHVQNFEGVITIKSASLLLFPPQIERWVINLYHPRVCPVSLNRVLDKIAAHQWLQGVVIIDITSLDRNYGLKNVTLNLKWYLRHILVGLLIKYLLFLVWGSF